MPCPPCGKGPKDTALAVKIDDGGGSGVAKCHRCGFVENWRDDRRTNRPGKPLARPVERAPSRDVMLRIVRDVLRASTALSKTPAEVYLRRRGVALPPADGPLRYIAALRHNPSGTAHPAMLAPITDAITGELIGLHRTYLSSDGHKAAVEPPRMVLGRKAGGVVRLWPDEAVTTGLGIAEGLESALALAHAFRPVWSCLDAGNMGAFPLLPGIECLTIAADHDEAGIRSADECARRWTEAGREVRIVMPPTAGADLNDVAQETA